MLDPLDVLQALMKECDKMNEANQAHAVNYMAIVIALVNKGILTMDEYERAKVQATSLVEQEFAQKRDEANHPTDPNPGDV